MKNNFLLIVLILQAFVLSAQNPEYKIRTEVSTKDSIVYSINEYIDTSLVKSYNCTFGDSIEYTSHSGFLWLKKRSFREYRIDKKWNVETRKHSELNLRVCAEWEPIILRRLK